MNVILATRINKHYYYSCHKTYLIETVSDAYNCMYVPIPAQVYMSKVRKPAKWLIFRNPSDHEGVECQSWNLVYR